MVSIIVSYDLRAPGRDYSSLYEKLKSYTHWAKITESTWFIKTSSSCVDVRDELKKVMDSNDRLFVGKLSGEAAWSNLICNNDYLKENL
jgi:hypothetical protein